MTTVALALSGSGARAHCALRLPDGSIREDDATGTGRGSDLIAAVDALCRGCAVAPHEVGELRVDVGPGSYTGLRVAVTFARTFAAFAGARLSSVTSLELLALGALKEAEVGADGEIAVVLDARRGRYHAARLGLRDGVLCLTAEPAALTEAELPPLLAGATATIAEPALHPMLGAHAARLVAPAAPRAAMLFDPRLAPRAATIESLEPLYLMATYAD